MDFIPKQYPDIEIAKARISKCIELSENREPIRYTERDKLTGLLNKDYFFRYVGKFDHLYKNTALEAVVCDVNSVNKQYGRQFGTHVLRSIGTGLKKLTRETGEICCREEDDNFLLYCSHQDNFEQLISGFLSHVFTGRELADKVSIRFGFFSDTQQVENVEDRFECAKIAADKVKDDPEKICGLYDQKCCRRKQTIRCIAIRNESGRQASQGACLPGSFSSGSGHPWLSVPVCACTSARRPG